VAGEVYRELGEAAWAWVLGQVRDDQGPWMPEVVAGDGPPVGPGADRDSVYAGIGGLARCWPRPPSTGRQAAGPKAAWAVA